MDALWDFSFKKFFAPKVIGILYGMGILVAALGCLFFIRLGFQGGFLPGMGAMFLSPILLLLYVTGIRIALEGLIAVIRVAEESVAIAKATVEISKDLKAPANSPNLPS